MATAVRSRKVELLKFMMILGLKFVPIEQSLIATAFKLDDGNKIRAKMLVYNFFPLFLFLFRLQQYPSSLPRPAGKWQ